MKTVSNYHVREFMYKHEVPESIIKEKFGHLDDDVIDGFFKYRNRWFHLSDFMLVSDHSPLFEKWDGYLGTTYFSSIVIKIVSYGDHYIIGEVYL